MHRLGVGTMHEMHSVITGIFWPSITSSQYTVAEKVRLWRGKFHDPTHARWTQQILATDLSEGVPKVDVRLCFLTAYTNTPAGSASLMSTSTGSRRRSKASTRSTTRPTAPTPRNPTRFDASCLRTC